MRLSFYLASVISALAAHHYTVKAVKLDYQDNGFDDYGHS